MFSATRIQLAGIALLAALSWTTRALADELSSAPPPVTAAVVPSTTTTSTPAPSSAQTELAGIRRNPFGAKPVNAAVLSARRGGDRVFNDAQLKGVVSDNRASDLTTGMNVISEGAFSGASGLSTVIQNSGNNVLIQNATIVNVQLK